MAAPLMAVIVAQFQLSTQIPTMLPSGIAGHQINPGLLTGFDTALIALFAHLVFLIFRVDARPGQVRS